MSSLEWLHQALRLYELCHCGMLIVLLGSQSLSLKAPFPSKTNNITQDWLTSVLQENGIINSTTSVVGFWLENLKGGCHYKVVRVNLRYSSEEGIVKEDAESLVIKLLYWDKPIWERILIHIQYRLRLQTQDVVNLRSYKIESLFYKNQESQMENKFEIKGLRTPQVFFNLGDCFNNRFGMIIQDLSMLEDAQPSGFDREDSMRCLVTLAEFHSSNWGLDKSSDIIAWDTAAYWTGERECKKEKIFQAWPHAVANFPELDFNKRYPNLGARLYKRLNWIKDEIDKSSSTEFRTLCHGDYKISNLFINRIKQTPQQARTKSISSFPPNAVLAIDWQWFGYGNCAIDVASFVNTSVNVENIKYKEEMLHAYHKALVDNGVVNYPYEIFFHHYKVALLDFCMFCVVSKWSKSNAEEFSYLQSKQKDGLHLRSIGHMLFILDQTEAALRGWEQEGK